MPLEPTDPAANPPCYRLPCNVSHIMHPELEVFLGMLYRAKSSLYQGSVFELLDRAGATEEDHDVMFELSAVQAQWEFERNKSK